MRHVSLHDTIDTPSHTPAHTRLLERTPPYNRTEWGETPGAVRAPSRTRIPRALVVTHLSRTCCRSLSYMNIEGSLGSSLSFNTAFGLNFLQRALSSISTCEYSAEAPLSITIQLILSYVRITAFRPMLPHSCWSLHSCSTYYLIYT